MEESQRRDPQMPKVAITSLALCPTLPWPVVRWERVADPADPASGQISKPCVSRTLGFCTRL